MNLLHIDSSALGAQSVTRELSAAIVARWREADPALSIEYRDLDADPLPHLSTATLAKHDQVEAADSDLVLRHFLQADVLVIGAPMYNFTIPSTLKAWIDRVTVAGKTFHYTDTGPQGLAGGKRVIVASGRGGLHVGAASDFVEPYLSQIFGFMGIDDVSFVRAEGVAYSRQHRVDAIGAALASIPDPLQQAA